MKTPEGRAKGLMFRRHMPEDRGMLFDFEREEPVAMWMRNTYIPLDMVFIKANGIVHRVHERAQPLDETTIPAGAPVALRAGAQRRHRSEARHQGRRQGEARTYPLIRWAAGDKRLVASPAA